jgi:flagellar biosynthesis chaperone FliJ
MKEIQTEKILDKRRRIRDITLLSYENELDSLIQKKEELEKEMNKDSESGVGVNVAKYNLHLRIISSIIKLRDHINQLRTVDTAKWAVDEQYEDYRERRSEKYEKEYIVKAESDEEMRWSFGA